MVIVHVHELKARLSHFLKLAQSGKRIIVMNRSIQVAEINPPPLKKQRELGLGRKLYPHWKPNYDALLEPMSEEELALWYDAPIISKQ